MARKAFVIDEAIREKVRHLAGVGVHQDDIAKIIGCAPMTPAQIFWLKTRAHFREGAVPAHPAPTSDAEGTPPVVLLLQDNSREPEPAQALRDTQEKHCRENRGGNTVNPRSDYHGDPCKSNTARGAFPRSAGIGFGGPEQTASALWR